MKNEILPVLALCALTAAPRADFESGVLRTEAVVRATLEEAWDVFTTPAGYRLLGVPQAEFDLRLGGTIRTHYDPQKKIGDEGTIVHEILAYEPLRMIAGRTRVPDGAKDKKPLERCWSVTRLEPVAPDRTRIVLTILGWGDDEASRKAYEFFDWGNRHELEQLAKHFEKKRAAESAGDPLEIVRSLVGGTWTAETPGGAMRFEYELGPDGASVLGRVHRARLDAHLDAHLDRDAREAGTPYGISLFTTDAVHGARHLSVNDQGLVASGAVRRRGDKSLALEWDVARPDGTVASMLIELDALAGDRFRQRVYHAGAESPFLDVTYTRVTEEKETIR